MWLIRFADPHSLAWLIVNGFLSWLQKLTKAKAIRASWVSTTVTAYQEDN